MTETSGYGIGFAILDSIQPLRKKSRIVNCSGLQMRGAKQRCMASHSVALTFHPVTHGDVLKPRFVRVSQIVTVLLNFRPVHSLNSSSQTLLGHGPS